MLKGFHTSCMCLHCSHLHLDVSRAMVCDAFPDGIPSYIVNGHFDHRMECNNGVGYEQSSRVDNPRSETQSGAA